MVEHVKGTTAQLSSARVLQDIRATRARQVAYAFFMMRFATLRNLKILSLFNFNDK